ARETVINDPVGSAQHAGTERHVREE
ncbi:MAG: hypothetical protein RL419_1374, partial [Actinomycetota bacterium]